MARGGRDAAAAGGHRDVADDLRPYRERLFDALADVEAIDSADPGGVVDRLARFGLGDGLPVVVPKDGLDRGAARWPCGRWTRHQRAAPDQLRRADLVGRSPACSVMAGCPPAVGLLDVVAAALDAAADPAFNLLGVQTTTGAAAPLVVVHGPVVDRLGLHAGSGALGPGWRLNATIGRAVRLALSDVGLCRPGVGDMATHGHPGQVHVAGGREPARQSLGAAVGRARDVRGRVGGHGVPRRGQRRGRAPRHHPRRRRRPVRRCARRPGRRPLRRPRPARVCRSPRPIRLDPPRHGGRARASGAAAGRWWS